MKLLAGSTALGLLLANSAALAADVLPTKTAPDLPVFTQLPAVDGFNAKLSGLGGWLQNDNRLLLNPNGVPVFGQNRPNTSQGLFGAQGSISIPLGQRFGLQIDGLASSARGAFLGGGAAHLFARDPNQGLIGAYGSFTRNNAFGGFSTGRLGVEAEAYWGRFTLSGVAGWEGGTRSTVFVGAIPGFNVFDTYGNRSRFFDMVDVAYYPVDNWKVSVGHRYVGGRHLAALGTEVLFPISGGTAAAAFVEGRIGERGNRGVFGGLTFYFGQKDKTLIRRHREDDPPNRLVDDLFSGTSTGTGGSGGTRGRSYRANGTGAAPCNPCGPAPFCPPPSPPTPPPFVPCGPT